MPDSEAPRPFRRAVLAFMALLPMLTACGSEAGQGEAGSEPDDAAEAAGAGAASTSPQDQWWANLSAPCGAAFPGRLGYAPPGDAMLEGDELLVVNFDVCTDDEIRLPFHIEQMDGEWDRSRTWIFRRTDGDRIELRHDHRQPDGTEDDSTWYGAWTVANGSATEQHFLIEDREYADGLVRGWRVIIEPGVRYTYGTIRGDAWSWRVDFDLSQPLSEPPTPAWGYEDGAGPLR